MVAYAITNGKVYVAVSSDNRCSTVNQISKAKVFTDRVKAENYCRCLPTSLKNLHFFVQQLDEDAKTETTMTALANVAASDSPIPEEILDLSYWQAEVERFSEFVQRAKSYKSTLLARQLREEDKSLDLLHAIEFYKLDVRRGYQLYQQLHAVREERRKCKNILAMIDALEHATFEDLETGRLARCVSGMLSRQYAPRALPELFKQEDIGNISKNAYRL